MGRVTEKAALLGAAFLFVTLTSGCAGPDAFGGSRQTTEAWGRSRGFVPLDIPPGPGSTLPLLTLTRGRSARVLVVYIEGDGAAWATPYHPPRDPTPLKPVALALAAADPAPAVAYLGRPCQYLDNTNQRTCTPHYWTSHRFAPIVVGTYQVALDGLKNRFSASRLHLIGYSGGGVLATLLASTRDDVDKLITVAAPVSVAEWTDWHDVTPLRESLDPATEPMSRLPSAIHFVGGKDVVVPPSVVAPFAARSGGHLRIVSEFDHQCCWSRDWPRLLEETR